jgi:5-methylcytosine-specific restriction endonuclease McrA
MAVRLCLAPNCPNIRQYRGYCAEHARAVNYRTHDRKRKSVYNSKRWRILRRSHLSNHPVCAGWPDPHPTPVIATQVDHIRPIEDGGDPWSRGNIQSLCQRCHSAKTRQEQIGSDRPK